MVNRRRFIRDILGVGAGVALTTTVSGCAAMYGMRQEVARFPHGGDWVKGRDLTARTGDYILLDKNNLPLRHFGLGESGSLDDQYIAVYSDIRKAKSAQKNFERKEGETFRVVEITPENYELYVHNTDTSGEKLPWKKPISGFSVLPQE